MVVEKTAIKQTFISDVISTGSTPHRSAPVRLSYNQHTQPVHHRPRHYVNTVTDSSSRHSSQQYARFYRQPAALPVVQKPTPQQPNTTHTVPTHVQKPVSAPTPQTRVSYAAPAARLAHVAVMQAKPRPQQTVQRTFSPKPKHKKTRSKRTLVANAVIALAVSMSIVLGAMSYKYHAALQKIESEPTAQQEQASEDVLGVSTDEDLSPNKLSEDPNVATTASSGGRAAQTSSRPYKISIPSLRVNASILSVGVTKSGAVGVPSNIWQVGWFKTSARPKDNTGVVILNGHVHGPTKPGVFANLKNIKIGETVTVTDTDGTTFIYKVVDKKAHKAGEGDPSMYQSASPDKQGLNLVTCDGKIIGDHYEDRLVVYTERI